MEEIKFINREEEIGLLKAALTRKGPELIILYGRRRIGKSRLLRELEKEVKADIFVMVEEADYATNLRKFSEIVAKKFSFPSYSPDSFKEIFKSLPEKTTVFIDEYSYIADTAEEFQAIWEEIAKPKDMKIVLCGSLIRVMEELNYSLKSPLYGRATKIVKVGALKLEDVYRWYHNKDLKGILETYFSVGGIPRYLEIIEEPGQKKIIENYLSRNGMLMREGKLLLKESFPMSHIFPKIMFSIANGITEASKIANDVGVKANEISKYLSILVEYGIVEKRFPAIGGNKKDTRFYMADRFFSFWGFFVWPYYTELEADMAENALANFKNNFNRFCSNEFEKIMIEVLHMNSCMGMFKTRNNIQIGRQWGKIHNAPKEKNQYEIDICAVNENSKEILFGECKWQEEVDVEKILAELKEKARFVDWHNNKREEHYAIFARTFKRKVKEESVFCYDLDDIAPILKRKER